MTQTLEEKHLIAQFNSLEKHREELDDQRARIKAKMNEVDHQLVKIEDEWLKTHDCSCGLLGMSCYHKGN